MDSQHDGAAEGHAEGAHGAEHGAHHEPHFSDINWFYGMIGTKEGVEPSVAFRPPEMPAPFGALLLNAAILYFILFKLLGKPILDGLKTRKDTILRGMDDAARMKRDAETRLEDYEEKLDHIDDEIERVRSEMREAGQVERQRILKDAKERRARMERDAKLLIDQELKAAREELMREAVRAAVSSASSTLQSRINASDQTRLADEYIGGLKVAGAGLRGKV
jgi:F-type H+-transporting ATPase subunit b